MRLLEREEWQRLWPRAAIVLGIWAAVWLVARLRGLGPDPLQLLLLVALTGAVAWLLVDGVVDPAPGWRGERRDPHDWLGHDPRTGLYVQLVEDHLAGRAHERVLREHLAEMAAGVLRVRHGTEQPLDAALTGALSSSGTRLEVADIADVLTRVERL